MLPTLSEFAEHMENLKISRNRPTVIYDCFGVFSAPRVWWTFYIFGMRDTRIMNGGLKKWMNEGLPVTNKVELKDVPDADYHFNFDQNLVVDK